VSFELPIALLGLLLVPVVVLLYLLSQRRRRQYAVRFTNLDLLGSVVTGSPGIRRHLPPLLFLLALAALTLAVARPHVNVDEPREEATVMLVLDSSGSMQAADVSPSRLVAARNAAKSFAGRLPDKFRLGFVSFNNVASLLVPPTSDRAPVRQALDGLQAEGGTAIGSGLEAALTGLQPVIQRERAEARERAQREGRRPRRGSPPAVVVLLSDGYSTTGANPLTVARRARDLGVPVNTEPVRPRSPSAIGSAARAPCGSRPTARRCAASRAPRAGSTSTRRMRRSWPRCTTGSVPGSGFGRRSASTRPLSRPAASA
jgi:Ca-activated chloride channel family protein